MGGLSGTERDELEAMRDALAERICELDDQVSYGVMTLEDKQRILSEEFGNDYGESLSLLNALLHHSPVHNSIVPHSALAAVFIGVLAIAGILAALVYPGMTGAFALTMSEIVIDTDMEHQDRERLLVDSPVTISAVDATYAGTGEYTLDIVDATRTRELLVGDSDSMSCPGCGEVFEPPLMLEMHSTGGTLRLKGVTVHS